jgi:hypothetical protein
VSKRRIGVYLKRMHFGSPGKSLLLSRPLNAE